MVYIVEEFDDSDNYRNAILIKHPYKEIVKIVEPLRQINVSGFPLVYRCSVKIEGTIVRSDLDPFPIALEKVTRSVVKLKHEPIVREILGLTDYLYESSVNYGAFMTPIGSSAKAEILHKYTIITNNDPINTKYDYITVWEAEGAIEHFRNKAVTVKGFLWKVLGQRTTLCLMPEKYASSDYESKFISSSILLDWKGIYILIWSTIPQHEPVYFSEEIYVTGILSRTAAGAFKFAISDITSMTVQDTSYI